ncbi:MAG: choice-of-anchor tandem repeat GloVer-containing protein [Steroidobacteraceae bacterium]
MKKLAHRTSLAIFVTSFAALAGCGGSGSGGGNSQPSQNFTVGGYITGLASSDSLVLLNNGGDALTVAEGATSFTMPTAVPDGSPYNVTVRSHPLMLPCTVTSGVGTVTDADVTSISVSCAAADSLLHSFGGEPTDGAVPVGSLIQATDGNFYGLTSAGGANGDGAVFMITPAGTETLLYSFAGGTTDGAIPHGSLIQAKDGNFYGMTAGGPKGFGAVFKITRTGIETLLYSFAGGTTDGAYPYGSLIQATDGNFYGLTSAGGAKGDGTVFMITPGGTEMVLHSFVGGTDGASPDGSLIQAADGHFYGLTVAGGANGDGTAFMIIAGGAETVLHSFTGGAVDGVSPGGSLIQAADGNFYGLTVSGGANGGGTVFEITSSGIESVLYSFGATYDLDPQGSLLQASDGNFYGVTSDGGASGDGTVFEITPSGVEASRYSFAGGPTDGASPNVSLIQAADGRFYGLTSAGGASGNGTVFALN